MPVELSILASRSRCLGLGLLFVAAVSSAMAQDPPEVVIGERLFKETRFAQAFRAFLDGGHGPNEPMTSGDLVMDTTVTTSAPLAGPFAGQSMNCRACHLVDEHVGAAGGGMRSYNDFARRSPVPHRTQDTKTAAPRNSPPLVNASLTRAVGMQLHFDAEFTSLPDLVAGTLTGRNYGWLPTERAQAVQTVARVIREDDGSGGLAQEFGALPYSLTLTGTSPSIPPEYRLPSQYRVNVATASDDAIFQAIGKLISIYTEQLVFSTDQNGNFNLSPFDVFLQLNGLPQQPAGSEARENYSRRLMTLIAAKVTAGTLQFVTSNPNTSGGDFDFHTQPFVFGPQELNGLRIFMREPAAAVASPSELAAGGTGNCIACHSAPLFTDFLFHNTGTTQKEYDAVHFTGAFNGLSIPALAARNAAYNSYLPATGTHPNAAEPFRAIPNSAQPGRTDLGVWNIFANPDIPKPQGNLNLIFCQLAMKEATPPANVITTCSQTALLPKTIATFKTPGLRDLGHSGPYMHTGQFDALDDIVTFYQETSQLARAGTLRNGARELKGIALIGSDTAALVAFLKSLNEDYQ
ncbi:MAG: hypothetical protein ABI806_05110 [Candidatus Solibacter sp.]